MHTLPSFEILLPRPSDPGKLAIRNLLVEVLKSQGEILPSANSPRGKLWHLVNSPDSTIHECEEVIMLDSALAARIFRIANSSAYAAQAENISQAIHHLGIKFVREQVFNSGVFKQYSGWKLPPEWDLFWLRSIFVARLCEKLSARFGPTNGSEYLAGLLHDIGWLFLATYVPDQFTYLFQCGLPLTQAEKEILPFTHAEISSAIAVRSALPLRAVNAILHHHNPVLASIGSIQPQKSARFLGLIICTCDKIADAFQMAIFDPSSLTMEEIAQSPEIEWLSHFGDLRDLATLAQEELLNSREIFEVFFSNRKFN